MTVINSQNIVLSNNTRLKKKYMNNRFGRFKSVVLRKKQYILFCYNIKEFTYNIHTNISNEIDNLKKLYDYLYSSRDIWTDLNMVSNTINNKLLEVSCMYPNSFDKYKLAFGYICPYIKRDGEICSKKVQGSLCKTHQKCYTRLKNRITENLLCLPTDICNIIFKYSVSYSLKL